jgi:hypothetical protein
MFAYVKYGKRFAVFAELSRSLGARPFFALNTCNGETILNIPYGQVILTPGWKLVAEAEHDAQQEDTDLPPPAARAAED